MDFNHYIPNFLHFFHVHKTLGLLFTFLMAFLEALPIIGTIVPGAVTMTLVGILVGTHSLAFATTFSMACLGAYTGDCIGFFTGIVLQQRIHRFWPFSKHPSWLDKTELFFKKYGGLSIIIGRFAGPVRSTVPMVAGMFKMRWSLFLIAAIFSAISWSFVYMGPGILLGNLALELPFKAMTEFILLGIIQIFLLWLVIWIIVHFFNQISRLIYKACGRLWSIIQTKQIFAPLVASIQKQDDNNDPRQLLLLLSSIVLFLIFAITFYNVIHHNGLADLNRTLFLFSQSTHTPWLTSTAILITNLGYYVIDSIILLLLAGVLASQTQWRAMWHTLAALIIAVAAITICKHVFHSPRPLGFQIVKSSSSFPSGHTTMGTVLFVLLAYFTGQVIPRFKNVLFAIATLLIVAIGLSRMYLGAHWFTDIMGSYALALCITLSVLLHFRKKSNHRIIVNKKIWLFLAPFCVLCPWAAYSYHVNAHQRYQYQPVNLYKTISLETWWQHPLRHLPGYRGSRFGNPIQPLNIQWHAKLQTIKSALQSNGFDDQQIRPSMAKAVRALTKHIFYQQPVFPWQYKNRRPALLMTKVIDPKKLIVEIRLWQSYIKIKGSTTPLWIGAINFRHARTTGPNPGYYANISYFYDKKRPLNYFKPVYHEFNNKVVMAPVNTQRDILTEMQWNGKVLLLRNKK